MEVLYRFCWGCIVCKRDRSLHYEHISNKCFVYSKYWTWFEHFCKCHRDFLEHDASWIAIPLFLLCLVQKTKVQWSAHLVCIQSSLSIHVDNDLAISRTWIPFTWKGIVRERDGEREKKFRNHLRHCLDIDSFSCIPVCLGRRVLDRQRMEIQSFETDLI